MYFTRPRLRARREALRKVELSSHASSSVAERVSQPIQPGKEAVACESRRVENGPLPVLERVETEFVRDDVRLERTGQVLLVGEDNERGASELLLLQRNQAERVVLDGGAGL